jgi:hypothetical protein
VTVVSLLPLPALVVSLLGTRLQVVDTSSAESPEQLLALAPAAAEA